MGVHTGDSVCVAPQQTLTDKQFQGCETRRSRHPRASGWRPAAQRAVRRQPAHRRDRRHRDEPARVALERSGQQGHRLPDRQDRRPAGRRLHAPGDPQRHHARHPGELRAGDRLLRGEVAPLRVREVPRRRGGTHHPHEVGGRGDGDRPHVQAGLCQGAALPRARLEPRSPDGHRTLLALSRLPGPERFDHLLEAMRRGVSQRGAAPADLDRPLVPARIHGVGWRLRRVA